MTEEQPIAYFIVETLLTPNIPMPVLPRENSSTPNSHGTILCKTIMEEDGRYRYSKKFRSNFSDITKLTKKIKIIQGYLS